MTEPDLRELGELLSLLAHDLKNPLATVLTNIGYVDGVIATGSRDDLREAMVDVKQACAALQRMIGNLELLSREATGSPSPLSDAPPLDLALVVDELVARHREAAHGRELRLEIAGAAHAFARADRDAVTRCMDNLLSDAVQHAPTGSAIELRTRRTGERVLLEVLDYGAIVPESERREVLSAAGQLRAKGRPEARYGRGLALCAAAIAARATDGVVEVDAEGERSVLRVSLTPSIDR